MRCILIDPFERSFKEVDVDMNNWRVIAPVIDANVFELIELDSLHDIYVDEEGLLKNPTHFFIVDGWPHPIAGKGLVSSTNPATGDPQPATITIERLEKTIRWAVKPIKGLWVEEV